MSITRGRTEPCKNTLSGVKNVYLWKWQPYSLAQIKGVRGVNLIEYPQTTIFKYPTLSNANTYEETLGEDNAYDQSLSVTLKKIDLESNQDLSKYHNLILGAVIEDYNGLFRLMGAFNGVDLSDLNVNVGSGRADFNGYKLTLESKERFKAPLFSNLNEIGLYVGGSNAPFIIEVNTANAGTPSNQFQFTGALGDYDVVAKQSGNIVQTFNNLSNAATLTFANGVGVYILEVTPKAVNGFDRIVFNNGGDKLKITDVKRWGGVVWDSFFGSFSDCSNVLTTATDAPNLSDLTNLLFMFKNATLANPDTTNWDVSKVTTTQQMFDNASSANPNVSNWDVGNVLIMFKMFVRASSANPNVSNWDVSSVTNMNAMFNLATIANPNVLNWDVSNVTNMQDMFRDAPAANPDVFLWDVSSVTNMTRMFNGATLANPNVLNWNVSSVTNMSGIFNGATAANPNVSLWDVSNVISMSELFFAAPAANPNVINWNVGNVTNMNNMFRSATSANPNTTNWDVSSVRFMINMFLAANLANPNVTNWNVGNVISMVNMFRGATIANPNMRNWNVSNVTTMQDMLNGANLSTDNLDGCYTNWSQLSLQSNVAFSAGTTQFTNAAQAGRNTLVNTYNWTITDGGVIYDPFIIEVDTSKAGSANDQFQFTGAVGNYDVIAKQGGTVVQTFNNLSNEQTITFANGVGVYVLEVSPNAASGFNRINFNNGGDKLKITDIKRWGGIVWSNFTSSFWGCSNVLTTATDAPNLSSVTSLFLMFTNAVLINPDTTNWDVSNVTNMRSLFQGATAANPNVSLWDVSSVTNMFNLFSQATSANPDLSSWNVSSVSDMRNILTNTNLSTNNLDGCYTNWSQLSLQQNVSFNAGGTKFSAAAQAGRDILVNTYNWTITDGGLV